jgi:uroporphyrinogen-III synthase
MKKALLVVREHDRFSEILAAAGCSVVNFPVIKTLPLENFDKLDQMLDRLDRYDGVFLTSPKAAEIFIGRCRAKSVSYAGKVYALGRRIRELLAPERLDLRGESAANTAEELIGSFENEEFAGNRYLFPRGDRSLRTIPELLKDAAVVEEVEVYRTVDEADAKTAAAVGERLRGGLIDWICFFSPSGVDGFLKACGGIPPAVKIAAIGKTTAARAAERVRPADYVAPRAGAEDFARGLIEHVDRDPRRE